MSSSSESISPVERLLPFTGYYILDTGGGNGLLIDTNMTYELGDDGTPHFGHAATITFQGDDGSRVYDFASCGTFENDRLIVNDDNKKVIDVRLSKNQSDGNSSVLEGTIADTQIRGATPFNPIVLPVFAATYFDVGGDTPRLYIGSDYSVRYCESSGEAVQVKEYVYNYAMFVISFALNGNDYTFEMGTTMGYGRVAGNAAKGGLLVSVPSFKTRTCPAT